jgi:hypothetical protein
MTYKKPIIINLNKQEKNWIPYQGPQGGQGWQNVESGNVVYDNEPPGNTNFDPENYYNASSEELTSAIESVTGEELGEEWDEMSDEEIRETVQEMASPSQMSEVMEELSSGDGPSDTEFISEGGAPNIDYDSSLSLANMPLLDGDGFEGSYAELHDTLSNKYPEGFDSVKRLTVAWKMGSSDEDAAIREKVLAEAIGSDKETRNEDEVREPSEEEVEAVQELVDASRAMMKEHKGKEFELRRGLKEWQTGEIFESLIDNIDSDVDVDLQQNAIDNFTTSSKEVASSFGDIVVETENNVNDVVMATDSLFHDDITSHNDEGEVAIDTRDVDVGLGNMYFGYENLQDVSLQSAKNAPENSDTETVESLADYFEQFDWREGEYIEINNPESPGFRFIAAVAQHYADNIDEFDEEGQEAVRELINGLQHNEFEVEI